MQSKDLFLHQTKHQVLLKFLGLLGLFLSYFIYLSLRFDIATGGIVALLTWSFFVLCTPIADAGFLLDFPLRIITGIRMFISEIFVWICAIFINIFTMLFSPQSYNKTFLSALLKKIIITPYPYWSIILLSGIGTFLSIRLGDEVIDVVTHKERTLQHQHGFKLEIILFIAILTVTITGYYYLLKSLGVDINNIESY